MRDSTLTPAELHNQPLQRKSITVTSPKHRWPLLLTIIVLAMAAAVLPTLHAAVPAALAQEPTTDASAPEGCYNGVLTTEIAHCYLFETAEREGRIKIESIYLEPTRALHVFLSRPDPIDEKLAKYFETTAHQRMEKNTREFHGDTDGSRSANLKDWIDYQNTCKGLTGDEKRHCYNTILGRGSSHGLWHHYNHSNNHGSLPDTSGEYTNVFMHTGGADAKKTRPGWASWRQLWPNKEEEKPKGVPEFDVSGIDTENIPEPVCREALSELGDFLVPSCDAWEALPDLGVGALHLRDEGRYGGTSFFHITSPIPTDQEELAALKQRLTQSPYPEPGRKVEIIPVKYDFGQLWKWKNTLERFALSDANTTGITFVRIVVNHDFTNADNWLVPPLWVGLTRVCKIEIIATNRPHHPWIPAYAGMTEWAR